jgi:hypothetical protein
MRVRKRRLTVTVDPELVEAATKAVTAGEADSVSAWVSSALSEKIRRDRKLGQLRAAIAAYEAEVGEISVDEILAQQRADREDAVVVRGRRSTTAKRRTVKARSA